MSIITNFRTCRTNFPPPGLGDKKWLRGGEVGSFTSVAFIDYIDNIAYIAYLAYIPYIWLLLRKPNDENFVQSHKKTMVDKISLKVSPLVKKKTNYA